MEDADLVGQLVLALGEDGDFLARARRFGLLGLLDLGQTFVLVEELLFETAFGP